MNEDPLIKENDVSDNPPGVPGAEPDDEEVYTKTETIETYAAPEPKAEKKIVCKPYVYVLVGIVCALFVAAALYASTL